MDWLTEVELNGNVTNSPYKRKGPKYTLRFSQDKRKTENTFYTVSISKAILDLAKDKDCAVLCVGVDTKKREIGFKLEKPETNLQGISLVGTKNNYRNLIGATALFPSLNKRTQNAIPLDKKLELEQDPNDETLLVYRY